METFARSRGRRRPHRDRERRQPLTSAIEAYEAFDRRDEGWLKVKLEPAGAAV
jgi:threonine dehydrogenase-like Zn-dependent dehydrogenase